MSACSRTEKAEIILKSAIQFPCKSFSPLPCHLLKYKPSFSPRFNLFTENCCGSVSLFTSNFEIRGRKRCVDDNHNYSYLCNHNTRRFITFKKVCRMQESLRSRGTCVNPAQITLGHVSWIMTYSTFLSLVGA